jgi:superfamily I DNA and/or RNA helicase
MMVKNNSMTVEDYQDLEKKAVLEALHRSCRGLSVKEIRTAVWVNFKRKLPEYYLSRLLRKLSSDGGVSFQKGRWTLSADNFLNNKAPSRSSTGVDFPLLSALGLDAIDSAATAQCYVTTGLPNENLSQSRNPAQEIFERSGPWSKFRNLIAYYKECIRNEEGADASAFINEYGRRYLYFSQVGEWYPKVGRSWRYSIPLGPHLAEFVKELECAGDSAVVVLGYPLQGVYVPKENEPDIAFIRPVFQYPLEIQYSTGALTVSTADARPTICLDWLKYALSSHDQQRNFLSACGLINSPRAGEDVEDYDSGHGMPTLSTLTTILSTFLSKKIKQPLLISEITSNPLTMPFETGIYNKAVIMIGSRSKFTKTLLNELSVIEKTDDLILDSTALQYIFRDTQDDPVDQSIVEKRHEAIVVDTDLMNADQRKAVAALISHGLSVITGPPGTGKSQVVCSGIANARLRKQTTIFASRNHKAIDAVVNRFRDREDRPLIVRTNSKEDPSLKYTFSTAIRDILAANYDATTQDRLKTISQDISLLLKTRGEQAELAYAVQILRDNLGELEEKLVDSALYIPVESLFVLDAIPEKYPVESIRRLGRFVSKNVLKDDPQSFFQPIFHRLNLLLATPSWVHAKFKLRKFKGLAGPPFIISFIRPTHFNNSLKLLIHAADYADIKRKIVPIVVQLKGYPEFESMVAIIETVSDRIAALAQEALALDMDSRSGLPSGSDLRGKLSSLKIALKALRVGLVEDSEIRETSKILKENIPTLLHHFPSWAVTNLSIGSRIPLVAGMFDLAIIDEASQSDIPSAIPILFRAKRAAAVGDPQQLTHTSKLSVAKNTLLRNRVGLSKFDDLKYSYIDTSLYDLFVQSYQVRPVLLSCTYRSVDSIAQYSNSTFYNGQLRVATDLSKMKVPAGSTAGIHWTNIHGDVKSVGGGGCFCVEEIAAIVEFIGTMLSDKHFQGTLGVVTPFRQQANRINDALYQSGLDYDDLAKAQVHVDTSHGFQGDEKDVMIFSLCAGPNMPAGSRVFLKETANLFNVAVSRARAVLHVFGDRTWAERCGIQHIQNLAKPELRLERQYQKSHWHPHESPWEEILYTALVTKGVKPIPQYPVSGRRLDMALVGSKERGMKIDIEVDGDRYHRNIDGSRKKDDVWRDVQLQGMGWDVMRFWVYQLREDLDGCVDKIVMKWRGNE